MGEGVSKLYICKGDSARTGGVLIQESLEPKGVTI